MSPYTKAPHKVLTISVLCFTKLSTHQSIFCKRRKTLEKRENSPVHKLSWWIGKHVSGVAFEDEHKSVHFSRIHGMGTVNSKKDKLKSLLHEKRVFVRCPRARVLAFHVSNNYAISSDCNKCWCFCNPRTNSVETCFMKEMCLSIHDKSAPFCESPVKVARTAMTLNQHENDRKAKLDLSANGFLRSAFNSRIFRLLFKLSSPLSSSATL